ncbi:MAG: AsmA-like C-terminal region-containing protein [bacterium]
MLKKIFLALVILVLIAFVGGAFALWRLQSYVQSEEFKAKVNRNVSETLGSPFYLSSLKFNILSGFDLYGIGIDSPAPNTSPFLRIQKIRLNYALLPLLQRQCVIRELEFVQPEMSVRFNADGSSNIPHPKVASSNPQAFPVSVDAARFDLILSRFNLTKGRISFFNADNLLLFSTENSELQGAYESVPRGAQARGNMRIGKLTLGPSFKLTEVQSSLTYADHKLVLPDINGQAYGGKATGVMDVNLGDKEPSFEMNLTLAGADLAAMMKDFGSDSDWIEGKLQLNQQMQGSLLTPKLATGKGELEINQMSLAKFQLFQTLSQVLLVPELAEAQFQNVKGTFKIGDQKITFFNLEAVSELIQLSGAGSVTFEKQTDFDVLLALHKKLTERMPSEIRKQLTQRDENFSTIAFKITGPLNSLKTNLTEKLAQAALTTAVEQLGGQMSPRLQEKANQLLNILKKDSQPTPNSTETNQTQPTVPAFR